MLVGEENQGWKLITTQLNHERVMLGPAGRIEGLRDRVADWATKAGVIDRPDVRDVMGRVTAVFRVNELLNWEVARAGASGEVSVGDASSSKVFAADQVQHLAADLVGIVHRYGDPAEEETKALLDYLDAQAKRNLVLTFGGGVQEVQRELIAMFGLGLPRIMAAAERIKALGEAAEAQAPYAVNQATIGTWLDAMGYDNDRFRAGEEPPSMAQVWTMPGLGRRRSDDDPLSQMMEVLTGQGYTAVLGTNC
eukprot:gene35882-40585_t